MGTAEIELRRFYEEIEEEVRAKVGANLEDVEQLARDTALAEVMLDVLGEEGVASDVEICPYTDRTGRRRCAITAFSFIEAEERLDLYVAQHGLGSEPKTLPSAELAQIAGKAARFLDYAAKAEFARFSDYPQVVDAARRINTEVRKLAFVRILVLTNALVQEKDVEDLDVSGVQVRFEVVDIERLSRISRSTTSREDIKVDFVQLLGRPLPCLEMTPRATEYETYLAIFSGELLFELYERYGQRLFEFNVRSFLQAKGKVNKGIRHSLQVDPDRFMAYNNGIVATADSLEVQMFHGETAIAKITGLQIVNGAQTTASIYRAKKTEKTDLQKVCVAVKITKVQPDKLQEFVPLISRFANTQNVIQVADLSANNPFHVELERLSEATWCPGEETRWFYERARGSYNDALQREGATAAKRRDFKQVTPVSQRITKTDLAKYLIAWLGRPNTVSMGAQKNFATFMAELPEMFPTGWTPDSEFYKRCISQAILFRSCERIVRARKFAAYRVNIAVYTYALLAHVARGELDLNYLWKQQRVSEGLEAMLWEWSDQVNSAIRTSAGAKNITEWCKKAECWEAVRSLNLQLPHELPPELDKNRAAEAERPVQKVEVPTEKPETEVAWDDENAIEECMKYDAAAWAKLNFWGVSTGSLEYYERGVAHTLSEYASAGWSRRPSVKQARIGVRVLRRGRDAKLL